MKFENETDLAEWIAITYGIIKAFEDRGYALYELGPGPVMFHGTGMVEEFIQFGRAEDVLQVGVRHMLLPLVENSKDSFQVLKAVEEMVRQVRAPYFFNCRQDPDGGVVVLGKHLIDSIAVEPPFLEMSVDVRFGPVMEENIVEIPLADAAVIVRKQVMMALRGPAMGRVEIKTSLVTGPGLKREVEIS